MAEKRVLMFKQVVLGALGVLSLVIACAVPPSSTSPAPVDTRFRSM